MMFPNPDLYKQIAEQWMQDSLRQAETRRLLQEARTNQRSWVSQQSRRLLCQLGHVLVALGRWLERYEVSSAADPVELRGTANHCLADKGREAQGGQAVERLRPQQIILRGERVALRPLTEEGGEVLLKWNHNPDAFYMEGLRATGAFPAAVGFWQRGGVGQRGRQYELTQGVTYSRLREALADLADADPSINSGRSLEQKRPTNGGDLWPTWRIFWTLTHHDTHHGAEIGCLRYLYRAMRR